MHKALSFFLAEEEFCYQELDQSFKAIHSPGVTSDLN